MLLKKIFWFWWRKKKFDSEFLSYNLMLNSWKKIRALRDKKNILTLVLSEKNFLNETKNHTPPPLFKLNGRSLNTNVETNMFVYLPKTIVVVIVWQLPMQSVPFTTEVVNSNFAHGEVCSIQHCLIKFVNDLCRSIGFFQVFRFSKLIKLTAMI